VIAVWLNDGGGKGVEAHGDTNGDTNGDANGDANGGGAVGAWRGAANGVATEAAVGDVGDDVDEGDATLPPRRAASWRSRSSLMASASVISRSPARHISSARAPIVAHDSLLESAGGLWPCLVWPWSPGFEWSLTRLV
jgi:hypothetical protein